MSKQNHGSSGLNEIRALEQKAKSIKNDTEEFISTAKKLSTEGLREAKSLIGLAKSNWKTVLGAAAALGIGGAILKKTKTVTKSRKIKALTKTVKKAKGKVSKTKKH